MAGKITYIITKNKSYNNTDAALQKPLCRDPIGQQRVATLVDVSLLEALGSSLLVTVEALHLTLWSLEVPTVVADLSLALQQSHGYAYIFFLNCNYKCIVSVMKAIKNFNMFDLMQNCVI